MQCVCTGVALSDPKSAQDCEELTSCKLTFFKTPGGEEQQADSDLCNTVCGDIGCVGDCDVSLLALLKVNVFVANRHGGYDLQLGPCTHWAASVQLP